MRKKIALLAGGYSGEAVISLKTAQNIRNHLSSNLYEVFLINIDHSGWWFQGVEERVDVDKNDFSIKIDEQKITFDFAFIAVHGSPGEDGKLQGYFDLINLPYSTCNVLVSALTFNKYFCNKALQSAKITPIAHSVLLQKDKNFSLGSILESLTFPLFIKPNEGGSSLGVSKVKTPSEVLPAIEKSFKEFSQVLIEEYIEGTEVTIGVYREGNKTKVLPPTELVSKNEFFDFEAKYNKGVTDEITPARISKKHNKELDKVAGDIYNELNCRGLVRIDFIIQKDTEKIYFLEVNTVPGQSERSLIPQQVAVAGLDLENFYGNIIETCSKAFRK